MQSLLNSTVIFIVASFVTFVVFDFTINVIALWKNCNPQQIASQQMQASPEVQQQIELQPQQEKVSDIWDESQACTAKRAMRPAPMIFQLALPPAKEVVITAPAKKRGRPSKKSAVTTLPTAETELAATFCQPSQIATTSAKKRGRPKKSVA